MRNPDSTKNTSTPRKPPRGHPVTWHASTSSTATARSPSMSGRKSFVLTPSFCVIKLAASSVPREEPARVADEHRVDLVLRNPTLEQGRHDVALHVQVVPVGHERQ